MADTPADADRHRHFRSAVTAGRIEKARALLEADPSLANAPIFSFDSRAVAHVNGNLAMLDLLLEFGADLNLKSDWWAGGWGVLDFNDGDFADALIARGAAVDVFAAATLDRLERLRELVAADPSLVHARGGDGGRPLHFAKSEAAMDLLLAAGAEIDARDVDHESTAAQWAVPRDADTGDVREAALQRVRWLLDRGAMPDVFMLSALGDARRLTDLLDADPEAVTARVGGKTYGPCPDAPGRSMYVYKFGEGRSPFEIARAAGHGACVELLRSRSSPKDQFVAACSVGDEAEARRLLASHAGLMNDLGPTDHGALAAAAWAGHTAAVRLMVDLGFDPLAHGPDTGTALHCAAWHGRAGLVRTILEHPAVVSRVGDIINAKEPTHGSTPLGWCCHGSSNCRNPAGDYPAVAKLLATAGGEPSHNAGDATAEVKAVLEAFDLA